MQVRKRDGSLEKVCFDKITARIKKLCYCLDPVVDPVKITQSVCLAVFDGVKTHDLDNLCAENSACRVSDHPDFGILAGRIVVSDLQKSTKKVFSDVISDLYHYVDPKTAKKAPLISDHVFAFIQENKKAIDSAIVYDRDYLFDYFGFKTLAKSYLLKINGQIVERPQHLLMRVSCGIHCGDLEAALNTYHLTSQKFFTHATPTLFNSGTPMPQMSSCFLLPAVEDSITGIYDTISKCATISKHAGGIGVSIHNIRANGSYIRGTNGTSNGIIPMLRVFNNTARYVDQCFAPDTLIRLEDDKMKPISEIKEGDRVLTHMGNYQKVSKVLEYDWKDQELYEVVAMDDKKVIVTGKHPLLTVRNQDLSKMDTIWPNLYHGINEMEWVAVEDLVKEKDVLCLSSKFVVLKRISRILEPKETKLYDLEVEKDHSYVCEVAAAHNGGGKRKGSFAIYLEPWHADIFQFLDLKKNKGVEELRARDLFYAMWVPDLFMKRVEKNEEWTLMCPNECPGLFDCHGPAFEALYTKYESEKKGRKSVKARELWQHILESQIETGVPYLLFKDACNLKSNQQNLGTIRSSNLCTEIIEFSSDKEIAVCNLASISLPQFVTEKGFDFQKLFEISKTVTFNLNKVIDVNYYPLPEAKKSNMRHRPIGIGTQGQHDVLCMLKYPYESKEAEQINKEIYETIYFGALTASNELAEKLGPYETYEGSPVSKGILQYDMWSVTPTKMWPWSELKAKIKKFGVRNSLLLAPMPTGTTSQILGNTEAFEIATSNIYSRRTLAGEFIVVNKHLLKDLLDLKLWTPNLKNRLIAANGSIQGLAEVPQHMKDLYKTVWEVKMKVQVDRAADRGAFIDQSQSFNIHMRDVSFEKLTALHFYSWKKGLKTGMYYLRTESASEAVKFTVIQELKEVKEQKEVKEVKEAKEELHRGHLETGYVDVRDKNHAKLMQMLQILNEKDETDTSCESCGS